LLGKIIIFGGGFRYNEGMKKIITHISEYSLDNIKENGVKWHKDTSLCDLPFCKRKDPHLRSSHNPYPVHSIEFDVEDEEVILDS